MWWVRQLLRERIFKNKYECDRDRPYSRIYVSSSNICIQIIIPIIASPPIIQSNRIIQWTIITQHNHIRTLTKNSSKLNSTL